MSEGPRALPTVIWQGQTYIIDRRPNQIRNAHDLGDFMDLDTFEQNIMLEVLNAKSPSATKQDLANALDAITFTEDYSKALGQPVPTSLAEEKAAIQTRLATLRQVKRRRR
ncbi:MAG TPA: hypothetical protein VNZ57_15035 [Longimicrobiales bacterium]|nr:hypothetical protein [Longimicrobiales bacterium]